MIKIKITWPVFFLCALTLAIWLRRAPSKPHPAPRAHRAHRPRPRRQTIIRLDGSDDYDTETERLDREAAEAGRTAYEQAERNRQTLIQELKKRHDQRYARR